LWARIVEQSIIPAMCDVCSQRVLSEAEHYIHLYSPESSSNTKTNKHTKGKANIHRRYTRRDYTILLDIDERHSI